MARRTCVRRFVLADPATGFPAFACLPLSRRSWITIDAMRRHANTLYG